MKRLLVGLLLLSLLIPFASATSWINDTAGTYLWTAPAGVTNITLVLYGAGGSGHGGWTSGGSYLPGDGGDAGDYIVISRLAVVPGTLYTTVVGAKGATAAYGANGNDGTYSSAFGYLKAGGDGGNPLTTGSAGGDGEDGGINTTRLAVNGTNQGAFVAGISGLGPGAGGGGGSSDNIDQDTQGGAGADGYVGIYTYGDYPGNTPDFSASPVTGVGGTLITFTDLSTITDAAGLSYNWSFGDGTYSNTPGSISHVYEYVGSYTVSLTLTSSGTTSITEIKEAYINLVNEQTEFDLKTEPKQVQFHVQTFWGAPLADANVSIEGITTSTGNWDWLVVSLGIPLDEVALNDTEMYQLTDSNGNAEFLMIPTAKYNVSTTLSGYDFPLFYVTPHDERYTIIANINASGWFKSGNDTVAQVNVTVNSTKISDTVGQVSVTYDDLGLQTTGGSIYIYAPNDTKGGADVLVGTMPITGNSFTNSTNVTLSDEIGDSGSYRVSVEPERAVGTEVVKTFTVWFKGRTVDFAGFDPVVLMWIALFCIIFTAMFSGATHAPQIAIIICVEAWIFYAMGWFDTLVSRLTTATSLGDTPLILMLSLATFAAIAWNFSVGKRRTP